MTSHESNRKHQLVQLRPAPWQVKNFFTWNVPCYCRKWAYKTNGPDFLCLLQEKLLQPTLAAEDKARRHQDSSPLIHCLQNQKKHFFHCCRNIGSTPAPGVAGERGRQIWVNSNSCKTSCFCLKKEYRYYCGGTTNQIEKNCFSSADKQMGTLVPEMVGTTGLATSI